MANELLSFHLECKCPNPQAASHQSNNNSPLQPQRLFWLTPMKCLNWCINQNVTFVHVPFYPSFHPVSYYSVWSVKKQVDPVYAGRTLCPRLPVNLDFQAGIALYPLDSSPSVSSSSSWVMPRDSEVIWEIKSSVAPCWCIGKASGGKLYKMLKPQLPPSMLKSSSLTLR